MEKAPVEIESEKPGWKISKGFDHAQAVQNEHVPWYVEWRVIGQFVLGIALLVGSIGLLLYSIIF